MDGGLIVSADQPQNLDGLGEHYFSHTRPRLLFRRPRSELPVFYASLTNNVVILVLLRDNSRSGALCGWLMLSQKLRDARKLIIDWYFPSSN